MAVPAPREAVDTDDVLDTLVLVVSTLQRQGIPFAVAGGCAVYARGGSPTENDVDVFLREPDVAAAADALVDGGLDRAQTVENWLAKVSHGAVGVDLIHRPHEEPVTDGTLAAAETLKIGPVHAPVISATELMVTKALVLHAHRCDLTPLIGVARELREQVDWAEVATRTRSSPYVRALLGLLADLDVIPEVVGDPADD